MLNFAKVSAASEGALIRAYMTQDKPEPETLKVHGVSIDGRDLETGERLTAYYTGRGERANWLADMSPRVAAALGVAKFRADPRDDELDALFEARRADNGADWSEHVRKNSGFDFVFAPHKSVSLAAEFAPTEAERLLIRNAIHAASDDALRYASRDLGVARKGHAGEKGSERGEIGWVTFAHAAARPTLAVQNGPDGATYLMDAPIAGDPHYHLHNFIPNLVVTDDGRVGSIDLKALTAHKVHEYGAIFQARLADRLRALGVRVGPDADGEAVVALDIPESAVANLFQARPSGDRRRQGSCQRERDGVGRTLARAQENSFCTKREATYKAVVYRGDKPEFFDLAVATGDRLRMYRKTVAQVDGKRATIGSNGDIVEVVRKTAVGLVLRNSRGQTAEIDWKRLSDQRTGRLLLGFGRAFTIDAAQGMSTKGEHINALPHGTAATSAFKTYTAESRATGRTHTLISKVAVHAAVQRSRALGDVTPMTEDDLWERVAKDASSKPYKAPRARPRRQRASPPRPGGRDRTFVPLPGREGAGSTGRRAPNEGGLRDRPCARGIRSATRRARNAG